MSDYYWPQNMPTALHINYIAQIRYTIHAINHNYFEVKRTSLIDCVTRHKVYLPEYYRPFFMKFLWRLYLALRLYSTFHNSQKKEVRSFRPQLLLIITHLDNVLEAFVRPALKIDKEDMSDWRNPNFDEYLITEFLLGRHDPATVQTFRHGRKTNVERMDFADLGRQTIRLLTMSSADFILLDWDSYDATRIHKKLEGKEYLYNVDHVPEDDLEELWDLLNAHHNRPFNKYWCMYSFCMLPFVLCLVHCTQ